MMYSECVRCPKLGKECDGPKFVAMPPQELIVWCKERKKHLGLTNAKLAELSGMAPGTIDSLLANTHPDFKFGTIRPLIQALVGGQWQEDPCRELTSSEEAELKERIRKLEADIKHRDDTIFHYKEELDELKTLVRNTNKRHATSQDFLREQLRNRNKAVAILSFFLGLCVLVIIGALIVDRLNPDKGFFWLTSWMNTGGIFKSRA